MKGDKVNNKQKPIFVQRAADTRRSYETLNFDYAIAAKLCQHFVFFFSLSLMYVVSFRVCRSLLVDLLSLPFAMAFERRKIHRAFFFSSSVGYASKYIFTNEIFIFPCAHLSVQSFLFLCLSGLLLICGGLRFSIRLNDSNEIEGFFYG